MPAETVAEKAGRLLEEGRVKHLPNGNFQVYGDSDRYAVMVRAKQDLRCSCPVRAKQECSHRAAVRLWQARAEKATSKQLRKQRRRQKNEERGRPKMAVPQFNIMPAVRSQKKARISLTGPAKSGKTYSALLMARGLVGAEGRIVVMDTERNSATMFANEVTFDILPLAEDHSLETFVAAIHACEKAGYDCIIIDSLSHAWIGEGGALEEVDAEKDRNRGDQRAGWKKVTPLQRRLIDAMLASPAHMIATMRAKTEWVIEKDDRGKNVQRKIGLAPIQRDGIEFEFDLNGDLDANHRLIISGTRIISLDGKIIEKPGVELGEYIRNDLASGPAPVVVPTPSPAQATPRYAGPDNNDCGDPGEQVPSTFRMSEQRETALRGALAKLRFDESESDTAIAWADSHDRSDSLVAWVKIATQHGGIPQGMPPWATEATQTGAETTEKGEAPLDTPDSAQSDTEQSEETPDPFGEEAPAESSGTTAPLIPEEPAYDADGKPANAAGQAHSDQCDAEAKANKEGIAVCQELVEAWREGEGGAVEAKYVDILNDENGASLVAYLGPRCHKMNAERRRDLLDKCGLSHRKNFNDLTVAERLYVAMTADSDGVAQ